MLATTASNAATPVRRRQRDAHCKTVMDISQRYADIFDRHTSGRLQVGHRRPGTRFRAGDDLEHGRGAGRKQRERRERAENPVSSTYRIRAL